jgi:C1A family cysteine protease
MPANRRAGMRIASDSRQFRRSDMPITVAGRGLGWLPDYPDFRDYSSETKEVKPLLAKLNIEKDKPKRGAKAKAAQAKVDLREWCSPIEDQGNLGSCTANAGVGLIEYFERRAAGRHLDASRLFLYKVTRNLLHWTGDTGAFLRTTMGAMRLFGVPPAQYWEYDVAKFDEEPPAFCYAFASNYQAIKFYRLDPQGTSRAELLGRIKVYLAAKLPAMFGFTVFNSIGQAHATGKIPFPEPGDKVSGGHAVVAVGYDDNMQVKHSKPGATATKGALLIRNSWGTGWGDQGYGWLPYEYVTRAQATDWWSLITAEYAQTGQFGF